MSDFDWDAYKNTISFDKGTINLKGYWCLSRIVRFFCMGIISTILIRPLFMKERQENIPFENVERIVVTKDWTGRKVFNLFQSSDFGIFEVHTFMANTETIANAIERKLKNIVPKNRYLYSNGAHLKQPPSAG